MHKNFYEIRDLIHTFYKMVSDGRSVREKCIFFPVFLEILHPLKNGFFAL
jgi:hypothetical protein